ncbi:uncharacterized protein LOC130749902 [Actinidia eriantha]|uniref:uncharacterized protein LOC130749902 n=1 Tax=Actinidia eriantha TaxID=165200 RepID=UPI0025830896|nr:uncharacterized protein LOC130749902 [Actinidia eriantha]
MAKGQKRKPQGNSGKEKGKKKKGETSSAPSFERNTLYFAEDAGQERMEVDDYPSDDVYPNLVAHFYANATKGYHCDMINSYVKGVKIELDQSVIRKILGLGFGNEKYRNEVKREQQLKVIYGRDVNASVQPKLRELTKEVRAGKVPIEDEESKEEEEEKDEEEEDKGIEQEVEHKKED